MGNVKIHVKLILQLRDAGMSRQEIASTRHISRNSVSEVFRIVDEKEIHYAMSNSLGFGGHNATLLVKKYEG